MDFQILGPLEVISDGGARATPRRRRERALVSVLLLFAGWPCSKEMLTRALWGDSPPADPAAALRVCVCRVRSALGPGICLTTLDRAYRADPVPGDLDLTRFRQARADAERMLQRGQLRPASAALQRALACWRHPPLADVPDAPEVAAEKTRLLEQRQLTELALADILLELGDQDRILPDLHRRVVADPLSERGWAQLVMALYQSGRRGEALAAYSRARMELIRKLGTEPGAELQDLLRMVLTGAPPSSRHPVLSITGNPALEQVPARILTPAGWSSAGPRRGGRERSRLAAHRGCPGRGQDLRSRYSVDYSPP